MADTNRRLDPAIMASFTGSETWHQHGLVRSILFTEGAKYVADAAGAYWLLDEIATNQLRPKIRREEFQVWKLIVDADHQSAVLCCEDGNSRTVWRKRIDFTDFPGEGITLYFANNVIHLPSEY
jgi:hypothetical protein